MEEYSWTTSPLLKYFLHGTLFSVINWVMTFLWASIFAVLVVIGLFIGLMLGIIMYFFFLGGINSFLTDLLWDILIKDDWKSLLVHGFALFIALLTVSIPEFIILYFFPSLPIVIVLFIIYCFIDGFIAKVTAENWEEYEETGEMV